MNRLRRIISGDGESEVKEGSAAGGTSDDDEDKLPDSGPSPSAEEKQPENKPEYAGDRAATNSGPMPTPVPARAPAPAPAPTSSLSQERMNMQLWELEEGPAGDCDMTKPPSEENEVRLCFTRSRLAG